MISICIPVLRRYDLLRGLLLSLRDSTAMPDKIAIVNNGKDHKRLLAAVENTLDLNRVAFDILEPVEPMGVAESWNWFIKNIPEERIICNDDVVFSRESVEKIVACPYDLVWTKEAGFSCFLIRDACVQKVGLFDETISPGYGY